MPEIRRLNRQQPHIETLQVSVEAVRIGPKQMTQSVFRQLQEEPLVDWQTGDLRGVPWGTVNYFWGHCLNDGVPRHTHVVWQKGDALRRCCLKDRWPLEREERGHLADLVDRLEKSCTLTMLIDVYQGVWVPELGKKYIKEWGESGVRNTKVLPSQVDDFLRMSGGVSVFRLIDEDRDIAKYRNDYQEKDGHYQQRVFEAIEEFTTRRVDGSAAYNAAHLYFELRDKYGVTMNREGDTLECDVSEGMMTDDLRAQVRDFKPELLAWLEYTRHKYSIREAPPDTPEAYAEKLRQKNREAIANEIRQQGEALGIPEEMLTPEGVAQHVEPHALAWKEQRDYIDHMIEQWKEQLEAIEALPQLFIAV